ncbi:hypothetical protein AJ78_07513 [Emergomyces pasteurianus Ep9510]|uniref:Ubiquitin-like domain-containing protein n=1 Tax=Emergomyces pasteurianus Ep9510 TaxID=1447872 RepID=A0A1J9P7B8_9EURO|nr:hypothetical protein AJ78_07513 [Emergomyces pasteurianus Ep9510]
MAELTFSKSFLTALDSRPVKLPGDYVFNPNSFPAPHPYTLPRLSDSHPPMSKKIKQSATPGSSKSIAIHLNSARSPFLRVTLDNCAISSTTVRELKEAVQARVRTTDNDNNPTIVPLDKIKILWNKKPVQGQTIAEILGSDSTGLLGGKEIQLGVVILGGATLAPVTPKAEEYSPSRETTGTIPSQGPIENHPSHAQDFLLTQELWDDLETFLGTKVNDATQVSHIISIFRKAWASTR